VVTDFPEFSAFWRQLWTNKTLFLEYAQRVPWLVSYLVQVGICSGIQIEACFDGTANQRATVAQNKDLYLGYMVRVEP
jgi:hypothetical protein